MSVEELNLKTKVLQLAITEGCDSHCIYCNFWRIKNPKYLSLEDIDLLFKVIDYENIDLLCVTGGEPTEHPEIINIIKHVSEITGKKVLLSTNCLNYERLNEIIKAVGDRIHTISTSLDGNKKFHDRNRGVNGSYSKVMKCLKLAKKRGIKTKLAVTVVEGNAKEVLGLLKKYSDTNLDIKTTNLSANYYGDNTEKTGLKEQKRALSDKLYEDIKGYYLKNDVKNLYTFYNALYIKHNIRPICTVGLTELFIFPNADIYACYTKDKLANFREITRKDLDILRKSFYKQYSKCNDCFARCSSSIVYVLNDYYQKIANQIVVRWRRGELYPEKDFFKMIRELPNEEYSKEIKYHFNSDSDGTES